MLIFLQPFISDELITKLSESTPYIDKNGTESMGVPAEVLPKICDVWIKVHPKGAVPSTSQDIAETIFEEAREL